MNNLTKCLDIKKDIEYSIMRGEYNNNKLPSITNMMEDYNCSRGTAVKVIDMLEKEGIVTRKQGVGCFLIPHKNVYLINKHKSKSAEELYRTLVEFKDIGIDKETVDIIYNNAMERLYPS